MNPCVGGELLRLDANARLGATSGFTRLQQPTVFPEILLFTGRFGIWSGASIYSQFLFIRKCNF